MKKWSFSSIKTNNTITAKICSGSSKECNKSIKFHQGYREQTSCSQKLQSRGEEINNEKIQQLCKVENKTTLAPKHCFCLRIIGAGIEVFIQ